MTWFERITGFPETDYETTKRRLDVVDGRLRSATNPRGFLVGRLETPLLDALRLRTAALVNIERPSTVTCVQSDVRRLHRQVEHAGALFQAASQFNLLEMVSPDITPEHGVTGYANDRTQGPACAVAAGAGTIYRNYFAEIDGQTGQRAGHQINCLRDVLASVEARPGELGEVRNGYWMTTRPGLAELDRRLASMGDRELDELRGQLRIGLHWQVDVTDEGASHTVSQAYCSALPVAYNRINNRDLWTRFASLVLDAAYEATLRAAMLNRREHGSAIVFLTRLGGGVFGNDPNWITRAMREALLLARNAGLDVRIVSPSAASAEMLALAHNFRV